MTHKIEPLMLNDTIDKTLWTNDKNESRPFKRNEHKKIEQRVRKGILLHAIRNWEVPKQNWDSPP